MPQKYTKEEFIKLSRKVHGNKYDYSKVEYVNANTRVCIVCPIHGEFWQLPSVHLNGSGCPLCGKIKRAKSKTKDTEYFLQKARKVHGDKYDYSKTEYKQAREKVLIKCPIHGEFWQKPSQHLRGEGCPECGKETYANAIRKTFETFVTEAKEKWGDKYNYSKVEYRNAHTKVCIICPEHGEFWQEPDNHLRWSGCPLCKRSYLEEEVKNFLDENRIKYESQKQFVWLKHKGSLKLDFYLNDYDIAIECQGEQHFEKYRFEKNVERLQNRLLRDEIKKKLCNEHGIKLIYYSTIKKHDTFLNEPLIKTIEELKNKIYSL